MANEIKLTLSFNAVKSGVTITKSVSTNLTWTGGKYVAQTISIGTSYEFLPAAADLGTPGLMIVSSPVAAADAVAVSLDGGVTDHLTIKGGDTQVVRLASGTTPDAIKMKSLGAGAVTIEYVILSD